MTASPDRPPASDRLAQAIKARFNIRVNKARDEDIDTALRAGVEMNGPHLWVLMFATVIASVGLNVNSSAVLIGAMLISPLMGPVMGIGYGIGIYDLALIRRSLKNLALTALLALLASAAYFALTPLRDAHSELLARTLPTLWDVLVAFFGGLAGIFAMTHKEKWTVIPGAAIATALMPPLCTAGYGLATAQPVFLFGALYLFAINCVFIAAASALVVTAFRLPRTQFVDAATAWRVRLALALVMVLTLLPSFYLAWQLVGDELFQSRAQQFVRSQFDLSQSHVVQMNADPHGRRIEVTLVGQRVPQALLDEIAARLPHQGLSGVELKVYQSADQEVDISSLRTHLLADLYRDSQQALAQKEQRLDQLREELAHRKATEQRFADIPAELHALDPRIVNVQLAQAPVWEAGPGWQGEPTILVYLQTRSKLGASEQARIAQWLRLRLKSAQIRLVLQPQAAASRH